MSTDTTTTGDSTNSAETDEERLQRIRQHIESLEGQRAHINQRLADLRAEAAHLQAEESESAVALVKREVRDADHEDGPLREDVQQALVDAGYSEEAARGTYQSLQRRGELYEVNDRVRWTDDEMPR